MFKKLLSWIANGLFKYVKLPEQSMEIREVRRYL